MLRAWECCPPSPSRGWQGSRLTVQMWRPVWSCYINSPIPSLQDHLRTSPKGNNKFKWFMNRLHESCSLPTLSLLCSLLLQIMKLEIEEISALRSFVFLWCGSGEGLDLGRMVTHTLKRTLNFRHISLYLKYISYSLLVSWGFATGDFYIGHSRTNSTWTWIKYIQYINSVSIGIRLKHVQHCPDINSIMQPSWKSK